MDASGHFECNEEQRFWDWQYRCTLVLTKQRWN
ncbi:hypothetical protein T4E_5817 [Trichinella pseudospiralis]|uniref:Uncharacterized protein n=1 Tax=Trichinella pseudospiralis TaxID=6337 RepID=A0A0V0WB32_TRIPS|nr:hypothetical protein T4E_5817 [Trichinella pseudospiralis]